LQFIKNNKMNLTYPRSLGVCFTDIESLRNITDFLKSELKSSIIEREEYKKYLMIITNNCNGWIDEMINIKKEELEYAIEIKRKNDEKNKEKAEYHKLEIVFDYSTRNANNTYRAFFEKNNLLDEKYFINGKKLFRLYYNRTQDWKDVYLNKIDENQFNIIDKKNNEILDNAPFKIVSRSGHTTGVIETHTDYFESIYINDQKLAEEYNEQKLADEYNTQNGGVLSKNKGKKGVYKSTKQKVSVIIDNKHYNKTVYKNSKGISYIRRNNEYKLLKKYKLSKL